MLDFDVGKLVVIGVVALIVIGPKDLPRVMRQVGNAMGKMRRMATEFQSQFMDAMREADVADLKKDFEKTAEAAKIDVAFDPVRDIKNQIAGAIEGDTTPGAAVPALEHAIERDAAVLGEDMVETGPQGALEDETSVAPHGGLIRGEAEQHAPAPTDAEQPPPFPPRAESFVDPEFDATPPQGALEAETFEARPPAEQKAVAPAPDKPA
jgi:sec-independent protein translocase protein TatB